MRTKPEDERRTELSGWTVAKICKELLKHAIDDANLTCPAPAVAEVI